MEDRKSLYERVWGEEPAPGSALDPPPGTTAQPKHRRRRHEPAARTPGGGLEVRAPARAPGDAGLVSPGGPVTPAEPVPPAGSAPPPPAALNLPELEQWLATMVKGAIDQVEASLARKLNYLESRVLNLTRFTREEVEKSEERAKASPQLKPIEETLTTILRRVAAVESVESRLKLLEGTLSRNERRAAAEEKSLEARIVEAIDERMPAGRIEELGRRIDGIQAVLAQSSQPQPGEQGAMLTGMVRLIDDRLGSGPIAELRDQMNELARVLGQTWRQAMAQNTEDQLKVVEILETRLESMLGEIRNRAAHFDTDQSRTDSELLSGFSQLAGQITGQLRSVETRLEHIFDEQKRTSSSVLNSVEAMVRSLEKFLNWERDARRRERSEPT